MAKKVRKNNSDMDIEEKVQVNPMIQKGTESRIKKESQRKNMHPTTLCGQILDRYVHYLLDKENRGDLMVGKKVLELMLKCETDEDYDLNSKKAATYVDAETLHQINDREISYHERSGRMKMWHDLNGFKFNETHHEDMTRWYVLHHMGVKWSKFQCLLTKNLLENTGMHIGKIDHNALSYWIEFKE